MKKVRFNYIKDKEYNFLYPTDAYGQISSDGKLVMHLFNEMHSIPKSSIYELDSNGNLKENSLKDIYNENLDNCIELDRVISSTLSMSPDDAVKIAFWMIAKVIESPTINVDEEKLKERFNSLFK